MYAKSFVAFLLLLGLSLNVMAQKSPVGIWKTIDDATGEAKSHVEIYEQGGKYYGKITKLLQRPADTVCEECSGARKNKPLVTMVILEDLEPYKDYWSYGKILDPENGKTYKCSLWVEDEDTLKLRGYIGISALGRSQNWYRVK
ncbi:MAG: DUF2147 domain-containing protein [Bacteroidota bacterium]